MFVYKNGVHYIDSLQDAVESQGDEKGNESDEIYISIPDDKWDEFADEFSVQVYKFPSCQASDTCLKLLQMEWFFHVIICSCIQSLYLISNQGKYVFT